MLVISSTEICQEWILFYSALSMLSVLLFLWNIMWWVFLFVYFFVFFGGGCFVVFLFSPLLNGKVEQKRTSMVTFHSLFSTALSICGGWEKKPTLKQIQCLWVMQRQCKR